MKCTYRLQEKQIVPYLSLRIAEEGIIRAWWQGETFWDGKTVVRTSLDEMYRLDSSGELILFDNGLTRIRHTFPYNYDECKVEVFR